MEFLLLAQRRWEKLYKKLVQLEGLLDMGCLSAKQYGLYGLIDLTSNGSKNGQPTWNLQPLATEIG
jgi:hypothetical protein